MVQRTLWQARIVEAWRQRSVVWLMGMRRVGKSVLYRLPNPAEVRKIAADHFPDTRILATGSSTLGASAPFRDTLAGRKAEVWLTPARSAARRWPTTWPCSR